MASNVRTIDGSRPTKAQGLVEPAEPSAEPFRGLRVALDLIPDSRRGNLMLFTSADPGEGKTTIAANYAMVSAVNERRVLLIDADLRNPRIHEIFSIPQAPGVTEALYSELDFRSVTRVVRAVPGLDVLTAGMPAPRVGDISGSNALRDLLTNASAEYDIVAIDSPPLLIGADSTHIAAHPLANVVLVVTKDQGTRRVSRALSKLQLVGANVLGFVVNREGRLSEYGYG